MKPDQKKPKSQSLKLVEPKKKGEAEYLMETSAGMFLPANHAKMIWQGNKALIVLGINYRGTVGSKFYIIGGNDCYGVLEILSIKQIDMPAFQKLSGEHRVTESERKEWWPGKKVLYAYAFNVEKKFDIPKRVAASGETKTFVEQVAFLSSKDKTLEENIYEYDPRNSSTVALEQDFKTVVKWRAGKANGQEVKHTLEELENALQLIMEELQKRNVEFHPEKMELSTRKLFEKVLLKMKKGIPAKRLFDFTMSKLSGQFSEAMLSKGFISLAGSSIEDPKGKELSLIVKLNGSDDCLKRMVEEGLCKMDTLGKSLSFVYGEKGACDSYVPLYDLVLRKLEPQFVQVEGGISLMQPFKPMEAAKEYGSTEDLLDCLFGGSK